jgi:ABC-type antimicrobial peptide transport system ATPase subunit
MSEISADYDWSGYNIDWSATDEVAKKKIDEAMRLQFNDGEIRGMIGTSEAGQREIEEVIRKTSKAFEKAADRLQKEREEA